MLHQVGICGQVTGQQRMEWSRMEQPEARTVPSPRHKKEQPDTRYLSPLPLEELTSQC